MPFTDVRRTLRDMPSHHAQPAREQNRPVLLLLGEEDPIIKGVDVSVYRDLFGSNVTAEIWKGRHCFFLQPNLNPNPNPDPHPNPKWIFKGRHCFFLQDSEGVHKRLLDWLEDHIHTSGIEKGFVGHQGIMLRDSRGCYDGSGMPPDHDYHD